MSLAKLLKTKRSGKLLNDAEAAEHKALLLTDDEIDIMLREAVRCRIKPPDDMKHWDVRRIALTLDDMRSALLNNCLRREDI